MFKWLMLLVYILLGGYVIYRGWRLLKRMLPKAGIVSCFVWIVLFCLCASSLFLGAFLPESSFQLWMKRMSNIWLGFLIYLVFFVLVADIVILILKLVRRKTPLPFMEKKRVALALGIVISGLCVGFTVYGSIHARKIVTTSYTIEVEKKVADIEELNLVLIADLHLGYSIGVEDIVKMVEGINAMNPDVVMYAGDIFDNNYDALDDEEGIIEALASIKTKYGSYAVFGNHDVTETLVGGFSIDKRSNAIRDKRMETFLQKAGITALLDEQITICDDKISLVGRLDGEKCGDGTNNRADLDTLLEGCDLKKPLIVLNHEPDELKEYAAKGVDVLLSGHTHAGQFFPLTITNPIAYENSYGLKKVGNMYSLVTSGIGVYGPAIRVGTNSEIMQVKIKFI